MRLRTPCPFWHQSVRSGRGKKLKKLILWGSHFLLLLGAVWHNIHIEVKWFLLYIKNRKIYSNRFYSIEFHSFCDNRVHSSKYSQLSFLPVGLSEKSNLFVSAGVLAGVRYKSNKSLFHLFQTEFNSNSLKIKTVLSNLAPE